MPVSTGRRGQHRGQHRGQRLDQGPGVITGLSIILELKRDPSIQRTPKLRRKEACRLLGVSVQTFRKNYKRELLSTLAFGI